MYCDICLPQENEDKLIQRAQELGYSTLVFLYPFKTRGEIQRKKEALSKFKFPIKVGIYLKPKKTAELKRLSARAFLEADLVGFTSHNEELIRAAVSNPKIDLIFGIPSTAGRDRPEARISNFNQIFVNLAKKNKIAYCVDFSKILSIDSELRAKLLGREMQNITISRKKISIILASFAKNSWNLRKPEDLIAFGVILGLNAPQAKASVSGRIEEILRRKELLRSKAFVRPGIKIVSEQ